jgi:ATP-binding cassette subfamily F protein uup
MQQLEKEIDQLETQKEELTQALNSGETDYQKLNDLAQTLEQINTDLEAKTERWLELSEYA